MFLAFVLLWVFNFWDFWTTESFIQSLLSPERSCDDWDWPESQSASVHLSVRLWPSLTDHSEGHFKYPHPHLSLIFFPLIFPLKFHVTFAVAGNEWIINDYDLWKDSNKNDRLHFGALTSEMKKKHGIDLNATLNMLVSSSASLSTSSGKTEFNWLVWAHILSSHSVGNGCRKKIRTVSKSESFGVST